MPCSCSRDDLRAVGVVAGADATAIACAGQEGIAASAAHSASPFEGDDAVEHYPPDVPLRPTHITLDLDFRIREKTLVAEVATRVVSTRERARTLKLNAEHFDHILGVKCFEYTHAAQGEARAGAGADHNGGTNASSMTGSAGGGVGGEQVNASHAELPATYSYDGHILTVVLRGDGLARGQGATIVVSYKVVNPTTGLTFSRTGDSTYYVVSDHETERARYWLPCVDHPSVRTTLLFRIRTEPGLTVLANGKMISQETVHGRAKTGDEQAAELDGAGEEEGKMVTEWRMDQITPSYLLCVAIGKFVKASGGDFRGNEIAFFAPKGGPYPYSSEELTATFGAVQKMIHWMENKLACELPWPKYYQFAVGEIGGAMENSSLVSWDESAITNDRDRGEAGWQVSCTNLHELAHSYFGNSLVCADFAYSFLKESFAKFMEMEWLGETIGQDDMHHHLAVSAARYIGEADLYPGGAWRLHMLRNMLGHDVFWGGIASYIRKNQWSTVEPSDLRRALEQHSGIPLAKYFDQWFEKGVGHPILEVSLNHQADCGGLTTITVKQTQVDAYRGIGLFDIDVDIALEVREGEWQTHIVSMQDQSTKAGGGTGIGRVTVVLDEQPLQIVVDPNARLLHKLAKLDCSEDSLKRSLKEAPTYAGRLMAANLLIATGTRACIAAVCDALREEPHWGLRGIIAQALGQSGKLAARDHLIEALDTEADQRTLVHVVRALHNFREPAVVGKALDRFLLQAEEKKRGYAAIMSALAALGHQRDSSHVPLLARFLEDPALRGKGAKVHTGAAAGLGAVRTPAALEVLLRNAQHGPREHGMLYFNTTREMIVHQIASCVEWESPAARARVFEFLEDICLRDPEYPVRMAACRALCKLSDAGQVGRALDLLAKDAINQDSPSVRMMRAEAASNRARRDGGNVTGISSTLEKVQQDLKGALLRVDELEALVNARLSTKEDAEPDDDGEPESAPEGDSGPALASFAENVPAMRFPGLKANEQSH